METTKFNGIDAVKIRNNKGDEITVLTGVGPRIISFKASEFDKNFFYVNESDFSNYKKNQDEWHIFGGTRIWISPETGASYIPDNLPCKTYKKNGIITIYSQPDREIKIVKKMSIQPLEKSFRITYSIINSSRYLINGGIWVLSCIEPLSGFKILIPWGEHHDEEIEDIIKDMNGLEPDLKKKDNLWYDNYRWNVKEIKFWRNWLGVKTNISSTQWKPTEEFFIIEPTKETGKVGLANRMEYAIYTNGEFSFVKYSPYIESANYPDDGCNFEFYTSSKFYEIETLSPLFTLKPMLEYTHTEHWWAGKGKINLDSISIAKKDIKKLLV